MGGGGGGGSSNVYGFKGGFRTPSKEKETFNNWFQNQVNNLNDYTANNPLMNAAQGGALDFYKQLPGMLGQFKGFGNELQNIQNQTAGYQSNLGNLSNQMGGLFGQLPGLQNQVGGYQGQLQGLFGQIPGLSNQLQRFSGQLGTLGGQLGKLAPNFQKFLGPGSALTAAYGGPSGIGAVLASQGALTQDQTNAAVQQARAAASASGSVHDPSAIIREYESRQAAKDARFNQALGQSQGVLGQQAGAGGALQGIYGQQAGLLGQRAGITGQQGNLLGLGGNLVGQGLGATGMLGNLLGLGQNISQGMAAVTGQGAGLGALVSSLIGQKAGMLAQQQGLQTGGLNQLLGVGNAAVSQYTNLSTPVLSYLGNLFGGNQNAAIAQAQINAQSNAAANSAKGGTTGGIASALGSIIGGIAMASDKRLKTKIKRTGLKTEDDIPVKTFEYKTRPGVPWVGVLAQDVEKKRPDAVITDPRSGIKLIDLLKINVPMARLAEG